MRSLNDQAQTLIQSAPDHRVPLQVMERIVLLLVQAAQQLDHLGYYALRYPDEAWLSIRTPPTPEDPEGVRWLPAFGYESDGQAVLSTLAEADPQLQLVSIEVLDLLFLCLGLNESKGVVFYDMEGDRQTGKTVSQDTLKRHLNQELKGLSQDEPPPPEGIA